jgi:methionyl aminopeptidase
MLKFSTQKEEGRPIPLHDEEGFDGMRRAGLLAARTLDFITPYIKPGVSTGELDRLLEEFMRAEGGVPANIGYHGYPKATCISVNYVVCHGIPTDAKVLKKGDILNIDVTPIVDGWHGDSSRMYIVGETTILARRLIDTTYEAMMTGINLIKPGLRLGDLGHAIAQVAKREGFSVVEEFCGHGVGKVFHDAPQVTHYGTPGTGVILEPGMIFTVEPMFNTGRRDIKILPDGWTVVTKDHSLSAQFEHSVGVTETGVEIFTLSPAGYTKPPYPEQGS